MGKQHNKKEKRTRRIAYLKRKKVAAKTKVKKTEVKKTEAKKA